MSSVTLNISLCKVVEELLETAAAERGAEFSLQFPMST